MAEHRCESNAETPKNPADLGTLWTPPEDVADDTTVIEGEQVPIFDLLENATGVDADADGHPVEQSEGDAESGEATATGEGVDADASAELPILEPPTVEYGGPRVEASPELSYADLPEDSPGPRPTLPPDSPYYEPSHFDMDDEDVMNPLEAALGEETVMESDDGEADTPIITPNFNLSETVVLNEEERKKVILDRLKEIEVALIQKQLRKFEIEIMEAIESDEYADVTVEIGTYIKLQLNYVQAFNNL